MTNILQSIEKINNAVMNMVWGTPTLAAILLVGLLMTLSTNFFQLTKFKHILDETLLALFKNKKVTKSDDKHAISQFQSLTAALASTIGTGNIVGVAMAISIGGPGAVFWMWFSAFFGMMTKFAEIVLGIYFRRKNDKGEWSGGAMYYLEDGLKNKKVIGKFAKPLAVIFAVSCVLASFGIGNMTQINSASTALKDNFNIPPLATGIILSILIGIIILGGVKRLGKVTEMLIPLMSVLYVAGTLIIFFLNFKQIPYVFYSIFESAFNFTSVVGGVVGYSFKQSFTWGLKRGVFSNEAGLGSSVTVHAASDVKEPVKQGFWGIMEVFIDTIVICTLTAFVVLSATAGKDVVTFDEALKHISTEKQYFFVTDDIKSGIVPIVDTKANPISFKEKSPLSSNTNQKTLTDGNKKEYSYSNIMSIRGIAKTYDNGEYFLDENGEKIITDIEITQVTGISLVTYAFSQKFGDISGKIIAIAILCFAFATVISWSFYGIKALEYLFGGPATSIYKVIYVLFVIIGATINSYLAWEISDTFNGMMAIPNLIGLIFLFPIVIKITRNYRARIFKGRKIRPIVSCLDTEHSEQ